VRIKVSQGSVETHLRRGGNFYDGHTQFLMENLTVKKFQNRLTFDRVITKRFRGCFMAHGVDI